MLNEGRDPRPPLALGGDWQECTRERLHCMVYQSASPQSSVEKWCSNSMPVLAADVCRNDVWGLQVYIVDDGRGKPHAFTCQCVPSREGQLWIIAHSVPMWEYLKWKIVSSPAQENAWKWAGDETTCDRRVQGVTATESINEMRMHEWGDHWGLMAGLRYGKAGGDGGGW